MFSTMLKNAVRYLGVGLLLFVLGSMVICLIVKSGLSDKLVIKEPYFIDDIGPTRIRPSAEIISPQDATIENTPMDLVDDTLEVFNSAPLFNHFYLDTILHNSMMTEENSGKQKQTRILLITSHRGGSSFLGETLNEHSKTFYWFEPLHPYHDKIAKENGQLRGRDIEMIYLDEDGQTPLRKLPEAVLHDRREVIFKALHCDMATMSTKSLKQDIRHWSIIPYETCMLNKNYNCSILLKKRCENCHLVVTKTIRFPVYATGEMLHNDPDLKVVYYIRDPRGIVNSRSKRRLFYNNESALVQAAVDLCRVYDQDLKEVLKLRADYPNQIMSLKYEDLATQPLETVRKLSKFIEHNVPENITLWIKEHTEHNIGDIYSTIRNSQETVTKWRSTLSQSMVNDINIGCDGVLEKLGYIL